MAITVGYAGQRQRCQSFTRGLFVPPGSHHKVAAKAAKGPVHHLRAEVEDDVLRMRSTPLRIAVISQ